MDSLARNCYASVYRGEMGSPELDEALRNWLDEQTGGLLSDQSQAVKTSRDNLLALCSTVCFRDKWYAEFSESDTAPGVFHSPTGDLEPDFMHSTSDRTYYQSGKFTACAEYLDNSGCMWLLLPAEGTSPEQLISDADALDFLLSGGERGAYGKLMNVNSAIPKFDVSSDLELSQSLKALGITDVFDYTLSDFTPLTGGSDLIYLSEVRHAARAAIDEQGVAAAAYTTVRYAAADDSPPLDRVDFILDRPFVFAIASHDGLPLFVGIVNTP